MGESKNNGWLSDECEVETPGYSPLINSSNKTAASKHNQVVPELHGFKFGVKSSYGFQVVELQTDVSGLKNILNNCNGTVSVVNITGIESDFVDALYECHIDCLNDTYLSDMEIMTDKFFAWRFDCSFNDKHVISSGNIVPKEIIIFASYLRTFGIAVLRIIDRFS